MRNEHLWNKEKRLLFIHNKAIWYRLPLFKKMNESTYDFFFCFTRENDDKKVEFDRKQIINQETVNLNITASFINNLFYYINLLCTEKCDVIISGDPCLLETQLAFIVSKLRKKPFVLFSEEMIAVKSLKRKLASPVLNFIVKKSNACVVPGFRHRDHLIKMGSVPKKIFIAPNASYTANIEVDNEEIKRISDSLNLKQKKIILYIGRIVEYKGLEYLLKSFKMMSSDFDDVFLLVAGTGDNEVKMRELAKDLYIKNIHFFGWVNETTKKSLFEMSDVVVLPSISHEAWGLTLNEAMYHGKPVITTNMVGAAYALVKDGVNGYVVKEKNVDALCTAMKNIISNPNLKQQMGIASKKTIEYEYNYDEQYKGFMAAIEYSLKII